MLPGAAEFAAIRFPGGYCTTLGAGGENLHQGDYTLNGGAKSAVPVKFRFMIGSVRSDIEEAVFLANKKMGRFPLLARVVKPWPGLVDVEPMPGEDGEASEGGDA